MKSKGLLLSLFLTGNLRRRCTQGYKYSFPLMKHKALLLSVALTGLLVACSSDDFHKGVHPRVGSIIRTAPSSIYGVAHELDVLYDSTSPGKLAVEIFLDGTDHGSISGTQVKRLSVAAGNHTLKCVWSDNSVTRTLSITNSFTAYLSHS